MKKVILFVSAIVLTSGLMFANTADAKGFGQGNCSALGLGVNLNQMLDEKASILGMSTQDLKTSMQTKTICQIVQEKNITLTSFHDQLEVKAAALLQQKVASGTITQAQADQLLQKMKDRHDNIEKNGCPEKGSQKQGKRMGKKMGFRK